MKILFFFYVYVVAQVCCAQKADTTVHKRHYSFCSYYPGIYDRIGLETDEPKILFCLGNYQDTLKTGHWLYFFSSGKLMAQGDYEKGIKTGKWNYYSGNGDYSVVIFSSKTPTTEQIRFETSRYAAIYDYFHTKGQQNYLLNGKFPSVCCDSYPRGMD